MTKNKMYIGIGAVLLLCIIFLCVAGAAGYAYQDKIMAMLGTAPSQNAAQMLPPETPFYASITPNLQVIPGYENLKSLYFDNPEIKALWEEFESEIAEEADITFENDIQPWLGTEVVMAIPEFSGTAIDDPSNPPSVIIAAQTTDKAASDQFINKILAKATEEGETFTEEVYKDVTLHVLEDQRPGEQMTLATFNDFVILSNRPEAIKDMIDRSQDSNMPSLVDSEQFKKITGNLPPQAVTTIYFQLSNFIDLAMEDSLIELPPEQLADIKAFDGVGIAGTLQSDGIQFDAVVTYDINNMSETMKASLQQPASPNNFLNEVPADAIFFYSANNLNRMWQQTKKSLENNPDFSEGIQDLETELGFSLDEDIFGWMTGEYGMVLVEVPPPDEFTPPVAGYLLIGTDDVNNAQGRVEKVLDSFTQMGMAPPLEPATIDNIDMQVMNNFDGTMMAGYGFYKDYFLLAYTEDSVKVLSTASQESITSDSRFKAVQNRLPDKNLGYVYADLGHALTLVEANVISDFEREEYEKSVRPFVRPIQAIGVSNSSEGADKGVSRGTVFILISE